MPKRSRSNLTPPQAATGSLAESTTAVNAALMSGSRRIDSTPYVPKSPSPNSNTMTSGWPWAISVSMVRVSAGPHFAVVVTIPRSVKIMVRRAPESSNAKMSRRSDTPVALKASTMSPRWRMRAMMAEAAAVVRAVVIPGLVSRPGGHADALAEIGEGQYRPQHFAVERLTLVGRRGVADAEDAADIQHLNHVAGFEGLGNVARVAEQGLAVAQCADHHIPARHLRHAAACQLQCVVARLVVEDLDHHHHPLLAGDVRGDPNLVRQAAGLRHRGDFIDDHRAHAAHGSCACADAGAFIPARW